MSERVDRAKALFLEGYNCSQSIVGAFCEDVGLDFETAIKISSSFGGGMGRLREVCGTVTGIFMLIGLKYGYTSPKDMDKKSAHYKLVQDVAARVRADWGTIVCRELLPAVAAKDTSYRPSARTEEYYKARPCLKMVAYAAALAESILNGDIAP